jgi:hypothetical protein
MPRRSVLHSQRYVKRPHTVGDPAVPVPGCACPICENARDDEHYAIVGNILGLAERGICPCGRGLDEQGRCIGGPSCEHFAEQVRR